MTFKTTVSKERQSKQRRKNLEFFFRWAIENHQPGFGENATIGVKAAAEALRVSRTTVTEALDALAHLGLVVGYEKAPYKVVSTTAKSKDRTTTTDRNFSISRALPNHESYFGRLITVRADDTRSGYAKLLLAEHPVVRRLVHSTLDDWCAGAIHVFRRLRTARGPKSKQGAARAFLLETTFFRLRPESETDREAEAKPAGQVSADDIRNVIERIRSSKVRKASFYDILDSNHKAGLVAMGSLAKVAKPPAFLVEDLLRDINESEGSSSIEAGNFCSGRDLMKWTYGFMSAHEKELVSISVCWVDTTVLDVVIRDLEVLLPGEDSDEVRASRRGGRQRGDV